MPPMPSGRGPQGGRFVLLRKLGDQAFRGQSRPEIEAALERAAGDLLRVNHTGFDEVFEFARGNVVTFVALALLDAVNDDAAFDTSVRGQGAAAELPRRA